jgi:hypothetical protein
MRRAPSSTVGEVRAGGGKPSKYKRRPKLPGCCPLDAERGDSPRIRSTNVSPFGWSVPPGVGLWGWIVVSISGGPPEGPLQRSVAVRILRTAA